jgi:hypothetical protein
LEEDSNRMGRIVRIKKKQGYSSLILLILSLLLIPARY